MVFCTFSNLIWFWLKNSTPNTWNACTLGLTYLKCFYSDRKKSRYKDLIKHNYSSVKLWQHSWLTYVRPEPFNNYLAKKQVSLVMWFVPRPPVRDSRVRIPSQHGNLVKFILVWVCFNPSGILTQPYPAFLLSASRPFNWWPSVQFGSLSPLTAKCQRMSVFVHPQGIKTVPAGGRGQKMAKLCPRSCWMTL